MLSIANIKASELRIAVTEYSPHVYVTNGQVKGPLIEYLKGVFGANYEKLTYVTMPNKRAMLELKKGTIDIMFPFEQKSSNELTIGEPIFNSVPGICFKKTKFIPFLSAPGALDNLNIGISPTFPLVPIFNHSAVKITVIEGNDVLDRGIQLLLRDRIDGFYHPSPINIYHFRNPLSKKIACSLFYGYSKPIDLALSSRLSNEDIEKVQALYINKMREKPYEYFLLDLRLN